MFATSCYLLWHEVTSDWVQLDLLWGFLSCVCYAFVSVCLYVPCGHLLGKAWPLGPRLWCQSVSLPLSHWYPGSGVVLDCIDSWSLHPYLLLYPQNWPCQIPGVLMLSPWVACIRRFVGSEASKDQEQRIILCMISLNVVYINGYETKS